MSRASVLGLCIVAFMILLVLLGPFLSAYDPIDLQLRNRLLPPSLEHPFGTDAVGRDVLSRVLSGGRIALQVGAISVTIALLVGVPLGLVSGYYGGSVDLILMACIDVLLAFPYLLLALIVVTVLGPSLTSAMIAVGVVFVPQYLRLVRGVVLSVKGMDYVLAARATGASNVRVMFQHILINSTSPIIVQASLSFGSAIVSAATLSFLGLGAQPPAPEWGAMLAEGRSYMQAAPWIALFPGLAIFLSVIGLNLVGDGLRDALDPQRKG
jgi:peptide/nickel transport system permease protein